MTQLDATPPPHAPALRIAVLLNSYRSPFTAQIRQSYTRTITAVSPQSRLTFFYPAEKNEFPDPDHFDLVVLGGSNVDPRKNWQWIRRVHQFVLKLTKDHPDKKLCGICWGHQTIARVFGGEVVDMAHPELGVTEVRLTAHGQRFFAPAVKGRTAVLRLQQHHRREVAVRPPGFTALSEDNQCLINEKGTILTFQGHPEKDAETAKLRIHDIERWFQLNVGDPAVVNEMFRRMELEDDGPAVWRRILDWAVEELPIGMQIPARMA